MSDYRKHLKETIKALGLQPEAAPIQCMSSNSFPNTTAMPSTTSPTTSPTTTPYSAFQRRRWVIKGPSNLDQMDKMITMIKRSAPENYSPIWPEWWSKAGPKGKESPFYITWAINYLFRNDPQLLQEVLTALQAQQGPQVDVPPPTPQRHLKHPKIDFKRLTSLTKLIMLIQAVETVPNSTTQDHHRLKRAVPAGLPILLAGGAANVIYSLIEEGAPLSWAGSTLGAIFSFSTTADIQRLETQLNQQGKVLGALVFNQEENHQVVTAMASSINELKNTVLTSQTGMAMSTVDQDLKNVNRQLSTNNDIAM